MCTYWVCVVYITKRSRDLLARRLGVAGLANLRHRGPGPQLVLELFEMTSRHVNAVLALGTTDHVLLSPTRVLCQKRFKAKNSRPISLGTTFSSPSIWLPRYIQSIFD
jgi:hypothetical protein